MIEELCTKFQITRERFEHLARYSAMNLCIHISFHGLFFRGFKNAWKKLGLNKKKNSNSNISASSDLLLTSKAKGCIEIILIEANEDNVKRRRCESDEFISLMVIMLMDPIIYQSTCYTNQIPTSILRGFYANQVKLQLCFTNMNDKKEYEPQHPWWFYYSVNVKRYLIHDDKIEFSDDTDVLDDKSTSNCSTRSDNETRIFASSDLKILLPRTQYVSVKTERSNEYIKALKKHPYTLSATVFCMANYLVRIIYQKKGKKYTSKELYLFIRSWLNNSIISDPTMPCEVIEWLIQLNFIMCNHQDEYYTQPLIHQQLSICLKLFENIQRVINIKHRKKIPTEFKAGRFQKYTIIDFETYEKKMERTNDLAVPLDFRKPDMKILCFERTNTTPLRIHASMTLLERWFGIQKSESTFWAIDFNTSFIFMFIHKKMLETIQHYIVPYMPSHRQSFKRNMWCPLFIFHMHNYIYGDNLGLLNSVKFCIKQFAKLIKDSNLMPKPNDPNICFFRILHLIIDRYGNTSNIMDDLTKSLRNIHNLRFDRKKKRKKNTGKEPEGMDQKLYVFGFRSQSVTLYSALRAFAYIYEIHCIKNSTLDQLVRIFMENKQLQKKYSMTWKLIHYLSNFESDDEETTIPNEIPELGKISFPWHLLLYYFCCSPEIEDGFAIYLFHSISIKLRTQEGILLSETILTFPKHEFNINDAEKALPNLRDTETAFGFFMEKITDRTQIKKINGLSFLMQTLEELALYPTFVEKSVVLGDETDVKVYRGFVNNPSLFTHIEVSDVLSSKFSPLDRIPLDFDENNLPLTISNALPVWDIDLYENYKDKKTDILMLLEKNEREIRPFMDAHEDFLSCIIMYPIQQIKALWTIEGAETQKRRQGYILPGMSFDERIKAYDSMKVGYPQTNNNGEEVMPNSPLDQRVAKKRHIILNLVGTKDASTLPMEQFVNLSCNNII